MPGGVRNVLDDDLWAAVPVFDGEPYRQVLFRVLILAIRDVLAVNMVLVLVQQVVPDYVVNKLFLKGASEVVFERILL